MSVILNCVSSVSKLILVFKSLYELAAQAWYLIPLAGETKILTLYDWTEAHIDLIQSNRVHREMCRDLQLFLTWKILLWFALAANTRDKRPLTRLLFHCYRQRDTNDSIICKLLEVLMLERNHARLQEDVKLIDAAFNLDFNASNVKSNVEGIVLRKV